MSYTTHTCAVMSTNIAAMPVLSSLNMCSGHWRQGHCSSQAMHMHLVVPSALPRCTVLHPGCRQACVPS